MTEHTPRDLTLMTQSLRRRVLVPYWRDTNGESVFVTLRGRTFGERAKCHRAGLKAGAKYGIEFDDATHAVESIWYALDTPRLNASEKDVIWDWHPAVIEYLLIMIHKLETQEGGTFDAEYLELEIARQTNLEADAIPPVPTPRTRRSGDDELVAADRDTDDTHNR